MVLLTGLATLAATSIVVTAILWWWFLPVAVALTAILFVAAVCHGSDPCPAWVTDPTLDRAPRWDDYHLDVTRDRTHDGAVRS